MASDADGEGIAQSRRALRAAILFVFFTSGAAALVYEVVWTRSLSLVFGVTTFAMSTVLATYMAGLALGSWYFGRWIDRGRNPLLVYAGLEVAIGLYALAVPLIFDAMTPAYVLLRQAELPGPVFALVRAAMAGGVLLVPTTMMGGTFPVLVRYFVSSRAEVGGATGLLYAFNTAGAVAGCVLAGFVLIVQLGLVASIWIAVAMNLGCALAAVVLSRFDRRPAIVEPVAVTGADRAGAPRMAVLVLVAIGLSGFAALAYEVLWSRALLRYVHNSVYAFTTMLTTFLAGIALGSALYTAFLRNLKRQLRLFGVLEILVGIGFLASAHLFASLPQIIEVLRGTTTIDSFGASLRSMVMMAGLILFVPSVLLGATLPAATHLYASRLASLGASVGRVYAVNTLGSIAGSLGAGFVLVPYLGMQRTLGLLVLMNGLIGIALVAADLERTSRRVAVSLVGAVALLALLFAVPSELFRRTFAPPGETLVYYQEGVTDTVGVVEGAGQRRILYEDQRGTAGTASYSWNYFLGHLPMLLHPGDPKTALHICFGVGNSLSALVRHPSLERVDNVELSPHILDAAAYFWTNGGVIQDPKVRTIIDDGRNHLLTTSEVYDVIALEPPLLFTAGVIYLYTREFYEAAAERLAPDGVLLQWLPVGEVPIDEERMIFRAMHDVFPHATAWGHHPGGPLLLIGTKKPLRIDYTRLAARMQAGRVGADMELIGIEDVDHLLSYFIFDEAAFGAFAAPAEPVTDDRTVVDFRSPRFIGSGYGLGAYLRQAREGRTTPMATAMKRWRYYFKRREPVLPLLSNLGGSTPEEVARRIEARANVASPVPLPIGQEEWVRR